MSYSFENFVLDAERRELRRGNQLARIEPQIFDLLKYLIQHREHVVSKNELIGAVWNGRVVSESTLSSRINAVRSAIGDDGRHQRLIKTLSKKGLRFVGVVTEGQQLIGAATEAASATFGPPDKPSIAVLPFANMSEDAGQEYFADGIVEEITTALSRFSSLFVIEWSSSFSYKGKVIDVRQVARELGVLYVLQGSVRKAGNKVRVAGRLIQVDTGGHIWAERYDGDLTDIFELQDQITSSVAGAIVPNLQRAEIERAQRKRPESLKAYDLYLRALPHFHSMTRDGSDEALRLLWRAILADPQFALASSSLSTALLFRVAFGWSAHRDVQDEAVNCARMALSLDREDPESLARLAGALSFFLGQHHEGIALIRRAVELNPNFAMAWRASGYLHSWAGQPETAVDHFDRALRLSPRDPLDFHLLTGKSVALTAIGRDDDAAEVAREATQRGPHHTPAWRTLAACLALLDRMEEARAVLAEYQGQAPNMTIARIKSGNAMIQLPGRLFDGLRKAGLSE